MANDMRGRAEPRLNIVVMRVATQYTSNISTNDHIKFDTIDVNLGNEAITPDIASPYTTGAGMSQGRVRLAPGQVYEMEFNNIVDIFSAASGQLNFVFFDVVSGLEIGTRSFTVPTSDTGTTGPGGGYLRQIYVPTSTAIIEVRLANSASLSRIGTTGLYMPTLIIRSL
jgi:hypothetical protein